MIDKKSDGEKYRARYIGRPGGPANGVWFLGFIGALMYYLNYESGTFWLVVLAVLKAIVWPALLVYHLLGL